MSKRIKKKLHCIINVVKTLWSLSGENMRNFIPFYKSSFKKRSLKSSFNIPLWIELVVSLMILQSSLSFAPAYATTCAEVYKRKAVRNAIERPLEVIAYIITYFPPVDINIQTFNPVGNRWKVAKLLEAASTYTLYESNLTYHRDDLEDVEKSKKILSDFYEKFILRQEPKTSITLRDIAARLHYFNFNAVKAGKCHHLFTRGALASRYFWDSSDMPSLAEIDAWRQVVENAPVEDKSLFSSDTSAANREEEEAEGEGTHLL